MTADFSMPCAKTATSRATGADLDDAGVARDPVPVRRGGACRSCLGSDDGDYHLGAVQRQSAGSHVAVPHRCRGAQDHDRTLAPALGVDRQRANGRGHRGPGLLHEPLLACRGLRQAIRTAPPRRRSGIGGAIRPAPPKAAQVELEDLGSSVGSGDAAALVGGLTAWPLKRSRRGSGGRDRAQARIRADRSLSSKIPSRSRPSAAGDRSGVVLAEAPWQLHPCSRQGVGRSATRRPRSQRVVAGKGTARGSRPGDFVLAARRAHRGDRAGIAARGPGRWSPTPDPSPRRASGPAGRGPRGRRRWPGSRSMSAPLQDRVTTRRTLTSRGATGTPYAAAATARAV